MGFRLRGWVFGVGFRLQAWVFGPGFRLQASVSLCRRGFPFAGVEVAAG